MTLLALVSTLLFTDVTCYTCDSVGGEEPLNVTSTFVNTTTLPRYGEWVSPGVYNDSIFMIGGYKTVAINIINASYIDTADNSYLWQSSTWQSDSNYGTITDMESLQQQLQIGKYLYMVGVGEGVNNRLLIYNLETRTQIDSANYNYTMPIFVYRTCMFFIFFDIYN